jgi:hypothetical protein
MKKKVLIFGMGLGSGFAKVFQEMGYEICIQYRNEKKKLEYQHEYPGAKYMFSDLTQTSQVIEELVRLKNEGFVPDIIIQSAGTPKTDKAVVLETLPQEEFEKKAIELIKAENYDNKVTTYDAFLEAYGGLNHPMLELMVGSKAGEFTLDTARQFGEVGYHIVMKMIKDFVASKNDPFLKVELIYPERNVDSKGLKAFSGQIEKETSEKIPEGEDPRIFAREIIQKYGL